MVEVCLFNVPFCRSLWCVLPPIPQRVSVLIYLSALHDGYGRHIYFFNSDDRVEIIRAWLRDFWVSQLVFTTSANVSKLAVWVLPPQRLLYNSKSP